MQLTNSAKAIVLLGTLAIPFGSATGQQPAKREADRNGLIVFGDAPKATAGPKAVGRAHLFIVDADGKNRKQITSGKGGYSAPVWSPDGERIACFRIGDDRPEILVMAKDGSGERLVALGFYPSWSPDGKHLSFYRDREKGRDIFTARLDGSDEVQVTQSGYSFLASWSPDGKRLVHWSGNREGAGQIWVMNADGSDREPLTVSEKDDYTPKGSSANAPVWSRQGKIAYWAGVEGSHGQIWVMDPDGKNKKQLTRVPAPKSCDNPSWSPDGTTILFDTNRNGKVEIWAIDADGTNERVVVSDLRVVPARSSWQPIRPKE